MRTQNAKNRSQMRGKQLSFIEKWQTPIILFIITVYSLFVWQLVDNLYQTLQLSTYQLAFYDQLLWASTTGNLLESSILKSHYLAIHFSPILLLTIPLSWFGTNAELLLGFQVFLITLPAFPLFLYVKKTKLHLSFRFLLPIGYLSCPAIHYQHFTDFSPLTLSLLPLSFALYFLSSRKYRPMILCLFLVVLTREDLFFIPLAFGFYIALFQRKVTLGILLSLFSVLYLQLCTQFFLPSYQELQQFSHLLPFHRYGHLDKNLSHFIIGQLQNPEASYNIFMSQLKSAQLSDALFPILFLALLSPGWLFLALPFFVYVILTSQGSFGPQDPYALLMLPFLWTGVASTIDFWTMRRREKFPLHSASVEKFYLFLITFGVLLQLAFSGMNVAKNFFQKRDTFYNHYELKRISKNIPPSASLSTSQNLLSFFSKRKNLHLSFGKQRNEMYWVKKEKSPYHQSKYHLLHVRDQRDTIDFYRRLESLFCRGHYLLVAQEGEFVLLKRKSQDLLQKKQERKREEQHLSFWEQTTAKQVRWLKKESFKRHEENLPLFLQGLNHPNPKVRIWSAWALGKLGDKLILPYLLEKSRTSPKLKVRRGMQRALFHLDKQQLLLEATIDHTKPCTLMPQKASKKKYKKKR